jgi:hypothetical protein
MDVVAPSVTAAVKVTGSPEHATAGMTVKLTSGNAYTVTVTVFEVKVPQLLSTL